MTEARPRRQPKKLSPETKWEIFLQVTAGEMTHADAARKWTVDLEDIDGRVGIVRRAPAPTSRPAGATR